MRMSYADAYGIRKTLGDVPLTIVVVRVCLAFSLPPYLSLDPARSRVPATIPLHYPLLVGHVLLGSVAMVAAVLQIWPGLRARHPRLHRRIGRAYVAAALPAAASAMVIGALTPFGPILAASNVVLAVLWLWFTGIGYLAGRRRHRSLSSAQHDAQRDAGPLRDHQPDLVARYCI